MKIPHLYFYHTVLADKRFISDIKLNAECYPGRIQSAVCNDSSDKYKMVEN